MTEEKVEATSPALPPSRKQHALALSCRECQRRKVKCDRAYPCGQCAHAALVCVPSTRKPRARVGAKLVDSELRARIAKLEKLVRHVQGEESLDSGNVDLPKNSTTAPETISSPSLTDGIVPVKPPQPGASPVDSPSAATSEFMAGTFWSSLISEVRALKDVFDEEDARSDDEGSSSMHLSPQTNLLQDAFNSETAQYELILCPPGTIFVMPGAIIEPPTLMAISLVDQYIEFVEPHCKLFHVPTLKEMTHKGLPYLGSEADAPCNTTLKAAIYFCAITSLSDEECEKLYSRPRPQLLQELRRLVDLAIYGSDPLNSNSIAILQALVLYINAIRVVDTSRRAWSLVALVIRIARAINIHRDLPGESVFAAEIRRRLWWNIVYLDAHSAWDRGSEPTLHPDTFSRQLPSNVNDDDFGTTSASIVPRTNEITDMSLSLLSSQAASLLLRMNLIRDGSPDQTWQERLQIAYAYQREVQEKYLRFCDPAIPRQRMLIGVGSIVCHSAFLMAVRPFYNIGSPPRVDSPWVLQLAVNLLRQAEVLAADPQAGRRAAWVPWHALAVTLAALCSIRGTELSDEAWRLVDKLTVRYAPDVADSRRGTLWRPIERLRKKAAAFRDENRENGLPVPQLEQPPVDTGHQAVLTDDAAAYSANMALDPPPDTALDFQPDVPLVLPNDNSWVDWENIMRDMDNFGVEGMEWG